RSLQVRRGFIWPAVDLYGGLAGFYDYGHNGILLRRHWEDLWIESFLGLSDNYHLIDTTTILPEAALKASGHVDHFTDILVTCTRCGESYRGDQLLEAATHEEQEGLTTEEIDARIQELKLRCPNCKGVLGPSREFHMMFPLEVGPTGKDRAYLRPETAQGVFLNFKREFEALRRRLPMGLAIVGRAYRNEISPRQGAYRMREFIQAELQIFFDPATFGDAVPFQDIASVPVRVAWASEKHAPTAHDARRLHCPVTVLRGGRECMGAHCPLLGEGRAVRPPVAGAGRTGPGRGLPPRDQGRPPGTGRSAERRPAQADCCVLRRFGLDRPPIRADGRDRDALLGDRRPRDARREGRHAAGTRLAETDPRQGRRPRDHIEPTPIRRGDLPCVRRWGRPEACSHSSSGSRDGWPICSPRRRTSSSPTPVGSRARSSRWSLASGAISCASLRASRTPRPSGPRRRPRPTWTTEFNSCNPTSRGRVGSATASMPRLATCPQPRFVR